MTKELFLTRYKEELIKRYKWATDQNRLDVFMTSVKNTLDGYNSWDAKGEAVDAAWKSLGLNQGKVSLKKLRSLS